MFTTEEFITTYSKYDDEQLLLVHRKRDDYSIEAQQALDIVIHQKGGLEKMLEEYQHKRTVMMEEHRIRKETDQLGSQGIDIDFIKKTMRSEIFSEETIHEIIDEQFVQVEAGIEDKKVDGNLIGRCLVGGVIASLLGGTLWGLQLIYSHSVFYIFAIGLIILCYSVVKLVARKTKKNTAVLLTSFFAVILSILIGGILYSIIGYIE